MLHLLHVGPLHINKVGDDIFEAYPKLFNGVGVLNDYQLQLHIDASVKPVAQPVRKVPFQLRRKMEQKLQDLINADIIEEVPEGPTDWVSPVVIIPKRDGDIRLCVDMRRANEAIIRERHPIPTIEDLLHRMNGSTMFSRLDLKWGFHQIMLDPNSRYITTFVTHAGLFRYKRLMFGISSAPEKYQKILCDVFKKCQGVANIADDVIIYGKNREEHDKRLTAVLERLQEVGLTLNKNKCEFRLPKLTFFGLNLSKQGVSPSEEKVAAIINAEPPKTSSEARSFMGLVQYSSKFIPNLATIARPILDLTKKDVKFDWTKDQQQAFDQLKSLMTKARALAFYRTDCKTRIIADASPVGLGAVLTQFQDGLWRVISYASRSLSDVERRYSQTEKEALGLVWACERFNLYIFGKEFELETDHKPLQFIYSKTSKPSARVERWVLRLQAYDFKVVYRPGKTNIADALSRLNSQKPAEDTLQGEEYDFVRWVAINSTPVALTPLEIEKESARDNEFAEIRRFIKSGDWSKCSQFSYLHVKDELCCYGELILRGTRLVIPKALREKILELAHEGHQGIVKTKNRLRTKVWWPKMDTDAERLCRKCHGCQVTSEFSRPEPMARVLPPNGPWQACSADILGPLPSGENILVIVDYYSRYFEIVVLKSITTMKIINAMTPIFARFGVPVSLRTDNGPQFISEDFENFLTEYGIRHEKSTPLWPQANGEVERQNRTLMKAIRIAHVENKDWKTEINKFLMAYRSTPQSSTGASPYYLMFGREMKTKLPELQREPQLFDEEVRDRDWENKLKSKHYADENRRAVESDLSTGDEVLLKNCKTTKLSPSFKPVPFTVVGKEKGEVTIRDKAGVEYKRNSSFLKSYNQPDDRDFSNVSPPPIENSDSDSPIVVNENEPTNSQQTLPTASLPPRNRPSRVVTKPARFDDYIMT